VVRRLLPARAARLPWPAVLLVASGLVACEPEVDRPVIAVLTPDLSSTRAAGPGRAAFRDRITRRCPDCVVIAGDDGTTREDLQVVLDDGADVVVVDASTAEQGKELVTAAGRVPLIAFDQFVAGADFYVSYDRSAVARTIADAVAGSLDGSETALVVGAAGGDGLGSDLRDALRAARVEVAAELDATSAGEGETHAWVESRLAGRGGPAVGAVLTPSDEWAGDVVEALRESGVRRPGRPLVTGVGADLEAVRRIITGEQALTVHMPVTRTAERAADLALALASGAGRDEVEGAAEVEGVPAFVYEPVLVSRENVTDVVVRDGSFTTEELCAGEVLSACERLGIR
jgi:D-xylose transport system substrate-binding protein